MRTHVWCQLATYHDIRLYIPINSGEVAGLQLGYALTVFIAAKDVADFRYAGTCRLECVTDIRRLMCFRNKFVLLSAESFFYRAMLCIRGTSHMGLCLCLSQLHKSVFH